MASAAFNQIIGNPAETALRLWGKIREAPERRQPQCHYDLTDNWSGRLGSELDAEAMEQERSIWRDIEERLRAINVDVGPASYGGHNDGDPAFIHTLLRLLVQPRVTIIETGVAHGVTSRFVLEHIKGSDSHLWSIDLPPPTLPHLQDEIGVAVPATLRGQWTLIRGSSRRHLPALLRRVEQVDLFIHDSWHSQYNMLFEMRAIYPRLRSGGAMLIDDIDLNGAFLTMAREVSTNDTVIVVPHAPVRADPLREQRRLRGLFGVIIKA